MSKKNDTTVTSGSAAEINQQPAYIDDLLKNGTTILTAKKREDFDSMLKEIPADCKYMAGAVGQNPETGEFSLRLDITTK